MFKATLEFHFTDLTIALGNNIKAMHHTALNATKYTSEGLSQTDAGFKDASGVLLSCMGLRPSC